MSEHYLLLSDASEFAQGDPYQGQRNRFESFSEGLATLVDRTSTAFESFSTFQNMSALSQFSQQQKNKNSGILGTSLGGGNGLGNGLGGIFGGSNAKSSSTIDLEAGGMDAGMDSPNTGIGSSLYSSTVGQLFTSSNSEQGYIPVNTGNGVGGIGGGLMDRLSNAGSSVRSSVEGMAPPSAERMQWFGILLLTGLIFLSISFACLPMIVISPHKFALMFSAGSACIFGAQVSLRGIGPFMSFAFASERMMFSAGYVLAWFGVLYSSLISKSYFLTLVFVTLQLTSMTYVLVSYVPGGTRFLNMIFGVVWGTMKVCCKTCCGGSSTAASGGGWFNK